MKAAIKPLSDRIEADIRARAEQRVDDALAAARDVAFRAYSATFRPVCGLPFDVFISDVMHEAEKSLRAQALATAEKIETETVLRRLGAEYQQGEAA